MYREKKSAVGVDKAILKIENSFLGEGCLGE